MSHAMSDLYRLVYASKNLLADTAAPPSEAVTQILAASQRNNAKVGVTGALMFNASAFAQVLEGPRRSVEDTFERIQRDIRHGDVTVLQCGPVESRGFANWSMAFVGQSTDGQALWNDLAAQSGFDHARLDGDAVFRMLHGLVLDEEACAPAAIPADPPHRDAPSLVAAPTGPAVHSARMPDLAAPEQARRRAQQGDRRPLMRGSAEAALAVFRVALASERALTTELRDALDEERAAASVLSDQLEALRTERNLWAERFRMLAATLCEDAESVLSAPAAEPETPRGAVIAA